MSAALPLLLGVLLLDPSAAEKVEVAESIVELEDDGRDERIRENAKEAEKLRISAERADFDREDGVVMFEGGAAVDYSADYQMRSDRIFVFFAGSNELDRIVAVGNVAITNGVRVGECASAVFRRKAGEIEMFGAADGRLARLAERGSNDVAGRRIKFWTDAEQVEIFDSEIAFAKGARKVKVKGAHE